MRIRFSMLSFALASFSIGTCLHAQTPITFSAPHNTNVSGAFAFGDLNGDGKTDLLSPIQSYLGDGKGNFTALPVNSNNPGYDSFVAADVNGDGKSDLVLVYGGGEECHNPYQSNPGYFNVLISDGKGGYTITQTIQLGFGQVQNMVVGDFNHDGKPDVAFVQSNYNDDCGDDYLTYSVMLNHGDGTFTQSYYVQSYTQQIASLAVGDFNGDGNDDLLFYDGGQTFSVLLGDGKGDFATGSSYAITGNVIAYTVGDVNHDGKGDIVVDLNGLNGHGHSLVTLLAKANGSGFYWAASKALPGTATALLLRDFNRDGKLDAVVSVGTALYSYPGLGNGQFGTATKSAGPVSQYGSPAAATLVKGGPLDLFSGDSKGITVLFNTTK